MRPSFVLTSMKMIPDLVSDSLCFLSPLKGVQLECLRCSHMHQDFPGKISVSEVARSQSVFPPTSKSLEATEARL